MSNIPPEIESLMWSVAESGSEDAIREFQERFPQHRLELMKRVNALGNLRKARTGKHRTTPEFRPTQHQPQPVRWGTFTLGGLALTAVAIGAYIAAPSLLRTGPPVGDAEIIQPKSQGVQTTAPIQTPAPVTPSVPQTDPLQTPEPAVVATRLPTPDQKPISLHVERANLSDVLSALAEQASWQLQEAPGTPNPEVRVDYDGVTATSIIEDMGQRFGFTAFDEGNHQVLVVPAVDGRGPTNVATEQTPTQGSAEPPLISGP